MAVTVVVIVVIVIIIVLDVVLMAHDFRRGAVHRYIVHGTMSGAVAG